MKVFPPCPHVEIHNFANDWLVVEVVVTNPDHHGQFCVVGKLAVQRFGLAAHLINFLPIEKELPAVAREVERQAHPGPLVQQREWLWRPAYYSVQVDVAFS